MKTTGKIILVLALSLCLAVSPIISAAEPQGWYIKKNGHNRPVLPKDEEYISDYNAYYIDPTLDDTSERKVIYLTFDAGYENGNVCRVLDVLKKHDVPATFFILDNIVLKNTDVVLRMTNEGHTVGNHTKNHKDMTKLTAEEMKRNLTDLEKIYTEKTGLKLSRFFRFPEGRFSEETLCTAKEMGYTTVFWSFAYADWDNSKQPELTRAKKKILDNTHNGEIILLHPTSATNAAILDDLITEWKGMGYTFGRLQDFCGN